MTRFINDQFAKDYLEQLLTPDGEVQAARRVAGEVDKLTFISSLNHNQVTYQKHSDY